MNRTEFESDFRELLKKHNAKIELWLGNGQHYMAVFVRNSPDEPFDSLASFTFPDEVFTTETITLNHEQDTKGTHVCRAMGKY